MLFTARAYKGMVVTPHRLASEAGIAVLRKGGNAVEAAIAAAATLCVVYPHMTGLGGDTLWLVMPAEHGKKKLPPAAAFGPPFAPPFVIDGCGRSAGLASQKWYIDRSLNKIPTRGAASALTMAGAVSGWKTALDAASAWPSDKTPLPLAELFEDAIALAEEGYPVSTGQSALSGDILRGLNQVPGFAKTFLQNGKSPRKGSRLRLPALAATFKRLADEGLDSFYRGSLADTLAEDLEEAGSPLRREDFEAHRAETRRALELSCFGATVYNTPPPTQGLASLMILAIAERLAAKAGCNLHDETSLIHVVAEATKAAFVLRNRHIADPHHMTRDAQRMLDAAVLDDLAHGISLDTAKPWLHTGSEGGDTVWFGVMDRMGNSVSIIQSIYHEFGSGLVLPRSGVLWHNRGLGFVFEKGHVNSLAPNKQPLHTLNPAMAAFDDGRFMGYGTMGGDGQPQSQAAIFLRYARLGYPLQAAIVEPRWLLGRAWGDMSPSLKVERHFAPEVMRQLKGMGHDVESVGAFSSLMGHAGALVRHPDGLLEGAFDPRSDGAASCW